MTDSGAGGILIFVAALLYSSVGHGGASGYLAVMALLGTSATQMRSTALVLNVFVASIAAFQFWRRGHFRAALFVPFAVASIPAAFVGGRITLPGEAYQAVVGAVLLLSAGRFLVSVPETGDVDVRPLPLGWALVAGAVLGFAAGLTGVGGGIFLSPALVLMRWATLRTTAAISAMFILVNSLAGLAGRSGALELHRDVAWWIAAAVLGGAIGARLGSTKLSSRALRVALGVVLFVAGTKLVLQGLT